MSAAQASQLNWRPKPWQTILIFGALLWAIYGMGSFTFDYFAGGATKAFGVWPDVGGVGMFFVYVLSFFITLVVILPILMIRRFGVGLAIYLPYAITGLFFEYYYDLVVSPNLVSYWGVVGWCVFGLSIGLSADLAYRFLPAAFSERARAIAAGVVMALTNFTLIGVALSVFYVNPQAGTGSFLGIAYYGLPLMLLNGGFGGYTAYAISRHV